MKKHFVPALLLLLTFLFSCDHETETPGAVRVSFKSFGLEGKSVNELQLRSDLLYAATDDGLYVKNVATNAAWQAAGLQGAYLKTLAFLPDGTLLAAGSDQARSVFKIYRKAPAATGFQELPNNFGGAQPESLNNFFYRQDTQELLAVGNTVVARSTDQGATWTPMYGEWQGVASGLDFVQVNPLTKDIWAGGQNAIEGFSLVKYSASTQSWQNWIDLLPPPSVAKDIAFHRNQPNTLVIGAEDGIIKTTDNGASWRVIRQENHQARFYFGLEFDAGHPDRLYAASWVKDYTNPQPLVLLVSPDAGTTWQEFIYQEPNFFGGVWDMVQRKEEGKTRLFFGLYKGGVFEATIK